MKIDGGIFSKAQILSLGKIFLEIRQKYKHIQVNRQNMAQNVSFSCKDIENWSRGVKDMSQTPEP